MQPNLKKTATGWPQERTHPIRYGFNFTTHHSWGKFHRKERKQFLGQKVPQKNADNNLKGAATKGPTITSKMVVAEILWNGRVQLLRIILLFRPPPPYWCVGLGWGDYGYWININIPICILTHWPALGTVLWPPTSVYAQWLHIRKSYSREKKPSTVSCVQASSQRLEPPLQYFYQGCPGWSTPDYNIQVGTVFTLFHKNLGKVPKKGESAWKST